ncbi:hypothetical protein CR513_40869, partial [Mucuna pruriens]
MRISQSQQKSYMDKRRRTLEFEEVDPVFLRITLTIRVGKAIKSKKLNLKIGPYKILCEVCLVTYQIALPHFFSNIHNIQEDLTYEARTTRIEDLRVKQLRGKEINLVKDVRKDVIGDTMWELKEEMQE